jgi:hypothetical protein
MLAGSGADEYLARYFRYFRSYSDFLHEPTQNLADKQDLWERGIYVERFFRHCIDHC